MEGDADHYIAMMDFIVNNDMAIDENFEYIKTQMDIDDFMDWCIIQNYTKNHSWKHNIKTWRPKTADGKWKWLVYDTDRGYVIPDDTLIVGFYENEPRFQHLYNNTDFRNEFLQRYSSHINITFGTDRVCGIIDSIKTAISAEMPNHILRWADSGGVQSMEYWDDQVSVMKTFANLRKGFVREYVSSFFGLNGTAKLTVNISEFNYGTVKTNGIAFPYPDSAWVYFKDIPIRLEASPKNGYEFIGWEGISDENEIFITLTGDSAITAIFEPICEIPSNITEDIFLLEACSPYIINEDIIVDDGATLYAEPGEANLFGDPGFINPYEKNFYLLYNSPCIDSGNPSTPDDPDGTRADIGALFYDQQNIINIPENELMLVYPNPTSGIITIMLDENEIIDEIEVANISGEIVLSFSNIDMNRRIINCTCLSKGIYLVSVKALKGNYYRKKFLII